ncbi:Alpha-helical ferredoxin [Acididesulfobacillus acetoxydans]|uniref:Alpha-helical ferredoxin n=1 Tax=Acididesulfobacillus acetoxydans TaxID=1561005 RepID=A0A8S0W434_9FIRM|nr:4Fe-4S dicluster domain-containing protein [Acididesulfobacillus acetoxydans]CAA7602218.1 Alpha-helical ferredoxin [Acididesulfobacillus acetoxydans]CEJ07564.1 Heterodisulfide reductase, C subunit [Acididesulfobacillus acetoxydans]
MKVLLEEKHSLLEEVEARSGQKVQECYQCSKCSGGCPFSGIMDYAPNSILEMIVYGLKDQLLSSKAIQMCIQCGTCGAQCPAGFEMYEVMNVLRELAKEEGYVSREVKIPKMNQIFLGEVRKGGRMHEVNLMVKNMLSQGELVRDVTSLIPIGPPMFVKGIMGMGDVFAHKIQGQAQVEQIFAKIEKMRGGVAS